MIGKKKTTTTTTKLIEMFKNQSATLRLRVSLGSGVVPIELHCGDVLMTNFDPVNFCPFDTFLKNTCTRANKFQIELEVV